MRLKCNETWKVQVKDPRSCLQSKFWQLQTLKIPKLICQVFSRSGYRMPKAGLKHHETKTSLYLRGIWLYLSKRRFCNKQFCMFPIFLKVGRGHIHLQRMWAWIRTSFGSFSGLWALSIWPVRQRAREPFLQSLSSWSVPRRKRWTWLQEVSQRHRYSTVRLSIHIRLRVRWRIHQHCSKWYISVRSLWGRAGLSVLIKAWASHHRTSCLDQKCRSQDSILGYVAVFLEYRLGWKTKRRNIMQIVCDTRSYTIPGCRDCFEYILICTTDMIIILHIPRIFHISRKYFFGLTKQYHLDLSC